MQKKQAGCCLFLLLYWLVGLLRDFVMKMGVFFWRGMLYNDFTMCFMMLWKLCLGKTKKGSGTELFCDI